MGTQSSEERHGRCLCGGITFRTIGRLRGVIKCYCPQCRLTMGNACHTRAKISQLTFLSDRTLTWYPSSSWARRGFCNTCGANIFWQANADPEHISIAAGNFDQPSGLAVAGHIYTDDLPDYEIINDQLPQYPASDHGKLR